MDIKGKVALVTGGGSGIGAAVTRRLVADGARVCITGRREEMLEKMALALPSGSVAICSGDVSKEKDVKNMVESALQFGGKIDVLVNNAGISNQKAIADLDPQIWREVIEINLTGPYLLIKEVIPHMIKAGGGSIINIASLGGFRCLPNAPAYCSSKAGLIMLTKQVALDYGCHKIRCNAVCPGGVKTDMTEGICQAGMMLGLDPETFLTQIASDTPLRRFADPDEIGGLCSYLASDDSSFMTGAAILIDGGTAVVDVIGASITASLRRGSIMD